MTRLDRDDGGKSGRMRIPGLGRIAALAAAAVLALTGLHNSAAAQDGGLVNASLARIAGPAAVAAEPPAAMSCPLKYNLPGDVDVTLPIDNSHGAFDEYSWQTFLALSAPGVGKRVSLTGDNKTQWRKWSSTVDVIQCARDPQSCVCRSGNCMAYGARYYPEECTAVRGYKRYRVLDQLSKIDDSFLQAGHGALSNSPLVDANGNFVRYEILVSPVAHSYVTKNQYYDASVLDGLTKDLKFPCGRESYTGGKPTSRRSGSYIVKNAWMQLPNDARGIGFYDPDLVKQFHTEELLVYTPAYRNKSGVATCEKRLMALVGQHIAHKTVKQPKWTWSTFEHANNAPNCKGLPPAGNQDGSGPNTSCPASVKKDYNFYPQECSADGSDPDACQTCNATPVSNRKGCKNPSVKGDTSWCLDKPPAKVAGTSMLCRQVKVSKYYETAHLMNNACAASLGNKSVWSNYHLIGTQWYNEASTSCSTDNKVTRSLEKPQVPVPGAGGKTVPYLANTSMESDVRSNCMGCHADAVVGTKSVSTDFMYWIQLEAGSTESAAAAMAELLARSPH